MEKKLVEITTKGKVIKNVQLADAAKYSLVIEVGNYVIYQFQKDKWERINIPASPDDFDASCFMVLRGIFNKELHEAIFARDISKVQGIFESCKEERELTKIRPFEDFNIYTAIYFLYMASYEENLRWGLI